MRKGKRKREEGLTLWEAGTVAWQHRGTLLPWEWAAVTHLYSLSLPRVKTHLGTGLA